MKTTCKSTRGKNVTVAERSQLAPRHYYLPRPVSLVSMTAIGMLMAQPVWAVVDCPAGSSSDAVVCKVSADMGGAGEQILVDFINDTEGLHEGNSGGDYTVDNYASLGPDTPPIMVRLRGENGTGPSASSGDDGFKGGDGGRIQISNNSGAKLSATQAPTSGASGSAPGVWDDTGAMFGIYAASVGGNGGNADGGIDGGDGGNGGAGAYVSISNRGDIEVRNMPYGGVGIYAATIGGNGGSQDDSTLGTGDQDGGNAGNAGVFSVTNDGVIDVSSSNAGKYAWGMGAQAIGGNGGQDGGDGGDVNPNGQYLVSNRGTVKVIANGSGLSDGVRGLYMLTQGGNGQTSEDGGDPGGAGGNFGQMLISNSGSVTVTSDSVPTPAGLSSLSGGIVMTGWGGNGGDGSSDEYQFGTAKPSGDGGSSISTQDNILVNIYMNNGSSITTQGDYLPGVNLTLWGGTGGRGRNESDGGNGGGGGAASIQLLDGAMIATDGMQSHGIVARSQGGSGGAWGDSGSIIDFSGNQAGDGGSGGKIQIYTASNASILTQRDNSIGILGQSMGGIGGNTGDQFSWIYHPANDGGNGGASGKVEIDNHSVIETHGTSSHGIVGQSISGGGGIGGKASGISAVGGAGGTAKAGGEVSLKQSGNVLNTHGAGAYGMLAQSIGGGGGDGGGANGVAVIGGEGAGGGAGGKATVGVDGYGVQTEGDHAHGLIAQSIGGGGGTGGAASAYDAGIGFSMAVAVGGSGASGGSGGEAAVNVSNASITTNAQGALDGDANAVVVQSIGGGGGAGGDSVARALTLSVPDGEVPVGIAASYALGGTGGNGGWGGSASSTLSNALLTTHGDNSQGVVVQSIGGGGGIGGSASATASVVSGSGQSFGATIASSLGGSGGSGGSGGTARNTLQGSRITTSGHYANAILLQSVGGGGGSGGIGSATGNTFHTDASITYTAALGGSGGNGGNGGTVNLELDADSALVTSGDGARGALVQSIGGGGGVSQGGQIGFNFTGSVGGAEGGEPTDVDVGASVSLGRSGPGGGDGGTIHVSHRGIITTHGADADGLLVQSVGGGGGVGGAVGGDSKDDEERPAPFNDSGVEYHLDAYLGGSGGDGGRGGNIGSDSEALDLGGNTHTYGDYADAIMVQSIGGGGGVGGASSASSSLSSSQLTLAAGGRGGAGGDGGTITAFLNGNANDNNNGNHVSTEGYGAMGIVLQSIGGGGGMTASGSSRAHGVISAGARGSHAGSGGKIVVNDGSWSTITTAGDSAHGLVLQSIGGGGGIAMAGSTTSAGDAGSHQLDLHAGSANASDATGTHNAQALSIRAATGLKLNTYGDRAMGVVAQSIGGGGGIVSAGSADSLGSVTLGSSINDNVSMGGYIDLKLTGTITTRGDGAHGIVAQSIGGGGGIVGDTAQPIRLDGKSAYIQSGSSVANNSSGEEVDVAFDGDLQTWGANAHGIVAQSIGGGGGLAGGSAGGFAGSVGSGGFSHVVSVTQSGTIAVNGVDSTGIFVQGDGGDVAPGGHPVNVTVNGTVQGGSGEGSGVWVSEGGAQSGAYDVNRLTINAGGMVSALSKTAVRYDTRREVRTNSLTIDNSGTIKGNIICNASDSDKACILNNKEGGVVIDAEEYKADVNNAGLLVIGESGSFKPLTVTGNFRQTDSGVLRTDVDFAERRASRMVVQGDANLTGQVDVLAHTLLPERELTVLTVKGNTRGALQAVDSPVFDYDLRQVGQDTRIRVASADFSAPDMELGHNHQQVAGHLQRNWDLGGNAALAPLFAYMDTASRQGAGSYRDSISQLSPGVTLAPAAQSAANLMHFTSTMMSCPGFEGDGAMTQEGNCFWGQVTGRTATQDASSDLSGFHYSTMAYQFGGQKEVSPGWFVGGSVAYENSHMRGSEKRVSGKGDSGYVGALLKRQQGDWTFSTAVGGGYGSYHMDRTVGIPGYQETLGSSPEIYGFNARFRAARTFAYDSFYVKPYVDLDASYTRMSSYKESGSNPLALAVESSDQFTLGLSPMVEIGGRTELGNGAILRPFMYAGVSLLSQDGWAARASLRGAQGAGTFDTSVPIGDVVGRIGAGLEVTKTGGVEFRLQYDGVFAKHVRSHSGVLKMMKPF